MKVAFNNVLILSTEAAMSQQPEPPNPESLIPISPNNDAFSVQFAWSENGRYFYEVTIIGEVDKTFIVCLDGVQEAHWGRCVGSNGRESIGTCQNAIEEWCRRNSDHLPSEHETRQINLGGIQKAVTAFFG
jgi:hypothetical protein